MDILDQATDIFMKKWKTLSIEIRDIENIPDWLRAMTFMSLNDINKLPVLDAAKEGELAYPSVEENTVTSDYIEFLRRQINLGARNPEWCTLLSSRLSILEAHIGKPIINITFYKKPASVTLRLDSKTRAIIHVEEV